mmetsp:Transcript_16905/g.48572  ORF Transcript_16905/g.48572 Transcript_16905/m.48572 type:complete len:193 (-) Transcript_16905:92-670(-)
MKSIAFVLSLSLQSVSFSVGFSPLATQKAHKSSRGSELFAADGQEVDHLQRKVAHIAATLALGWAVGAGSSHAAPLSSNDWSSTTSSSSFVVALSDNDFADFSLPSYGEATKAEVNTNLKGDKYLLGEASKSYSATSSSSGDEDTAVESPQAAQKAEPSAAELKAEKDAAKAAQKAARERQKAAAEAALAGK